MVDFGILPSFLGVLIHDGWSSYRRLDCLHGLCNAHHLRELAALAEDHGQRWAARMSELLQAACHEVNLSADGRLGPKTLDSLGVKQASTSTEFDAAGENLKHSYSQGEKDIGHGTKEAGSELKHGDVVEGAKDLGKGVGHGVGKMAVGTGHAAKNVAKGTKNAVTGDNKPQ